MLKFQFALIAVLICCVAFVSCERTQQMLPPAEPSEETMPADMTAMMASGAEYASWTSVALPAPSAIEDAMSPAETGAAHGMGTRTVYINEAGVTALKDATMATFPVGTAIAKEIMDDTNAFVLRLAMMMKTDDEMYAAHNGWQYVQYHRETADAELMPQAGDIPGGSSEGCHGCHAKAETDSVFVKLPAEMMEEMTDGETGDMTDGADDMTGDGADDMTDGDTDGMDGDMTGDGADDMTGDGADDMTGDGADDMTGDGAGDMTGDGADDMTGGADDMADEDADTPPPADPPADPPPPEGGN